MTVALLSKLVLAGIFATAGLMKLIDKGTTRVTIESLGVPARLIGPLSTVVPAAELLAAFFLIPPATSSTAAAAVLGMLIVFSAVVLAGLVTGSGTGCGCFGRFSAGPAWTLARNVLLMGMAALIVPGVNPGVAFVAALTLSACLGGAIAARRKGSDDTAPPFRLTSLRGGTVSLDDLRARGKPIVLIFLSAGCGSCAAVYAEIEHWQAQQLSVAVIAGGGAARNRDRAAGRSIDDHLLDSGGITASAYQVKQLPSAVVIDRRGRVTQPAIAGQAAIAATIEQLKAESDTHTGPASFGPVPSSATRWQATRAPAGPTGRSGGTSLRHRSSTTGQRV